MSTATELIARARLVCGAANVLVDPTVLHAYRSDGLRRAGPLPHAVFLPASTAEVTGVVNACGAAGVPFVTRGAGTSHSGSALPTADGVVIALTRMRRILGTESRRVVVEAGVPVSALPALRTGSWWVSEPMSGAATVGGHIAESRASARLAALDLVRPDGALVRLDVRDPGYDLVGAFAGSRGRAGIAVTLTLEAIRR